jgi:hypothetical protein
MRIRFARAVPTMVMLTSCTTYTPVVRMSAPTRETIRLSLTDASRTEVLGPLGAQVTSVEGTVRAVTDSAITMSVTEVGRTSSDAERFHGETVMIPSRFIVGVERKRVQVGRSLMIAGAVIGGALWIATQGHGDVTSRPPGGPPITGQ